MKINISYKSQIKLSQLQKEKIDNSIFVINQLYNFLIDFTSNPLNQRILVENDLGKFIENKSKSGEIYQTFLITKPQKTCTYIDRFWKDYAANRRISLKGLSKPIQTKMLNFLKTFNKINGSSKKDFRFKITSKDSYGSFSTDSSIKLIKKKIKYNGKKKTKCFVKIGKELFQFKNKNLNIKNFIPKTATISRKNGKYFISLSGYKNIKEPNINLNNYIGIDVNFENISLSNGIQFQLNNLQNKLNLYTEKFMVLKQKQSKRIEIAKEKLKIQCKKDKIDLYNGKKLTKEAKKLYRSILSSDKKYLKLKKQINNLYEKRTNIQEDLYKKIAKQLIDNYDLCFIEKLDINNMVNSQKVKNINLYNASLGKLLLIIKNKASTFGKIVIEVNSNYTSKTCNNCKEIYHDLKMERFWICPTCGTKHNRDHNAAKNIEELGLIQLHSGIGV